MDYTTESEVSTSKDEQTFSITLNADQRRLLMYTGVAIAGYFLARHLVNTAVKKIRDD